MGADFTDSRVVGGVPRTSRNLYKVVVQTTLVFVAETWVVSTRIENTLGWFHHRLEIRLVVMQTR